MRKVSKIFEPCTGSNSARQRLQTLGMNVEGTGDEGLPLRQAWQAVGKPLRNLVLENLVVLEEGIEL